MSPFAQALQSWHDFYSLTGSAAATLIGLVFVVLSFGLGLRHAPLDDISTFVTPAVIYFVDVLVISALSLAPIPGEGVAATLLTLLVAANVVPGVRRLVNAWRWHQKNRMSVRNWLWQFAAPGLSFLLLFAGAAALFDRRPSALYAVAASLMAFLLIGVRNAWILVVWLLQRGRE